MSPQEAEIAADLGLSQLPGPRYDDIPKAQPDPEEAGCVMRFKKALTLVDPIATAAFSRYIPDMIPIDQSLDSRGWSRGYSFAVNIRTDKPIAVNRKITAATGIGKGANEKNWYQLIAQRMLQLYIEMGAYCMSPPLIYRTTVKERRSGAIPMLGAIFKFGRRPADGAALSSTQAAWGIMHPATLATRRRAVPIVKKVQNPGASPLIRFPKPKIVIP